MAFEKLGYRELYDSMTTELRRRVPELTDFAEGSVVRSLMEAFAYEMGVLYQQMDLVYEAGFVDTATGPNLDRVVAVLGIKRNDPDFAIGEVTFERDPGSDQELVIPAGTLVTTEEKADETPSKRAYLTREDGMLRRGETTVDVKVQAAEPGGRMVSGSETVVVMPRPVPGVKKVSNRKPIRFQGRERETDEELRERAKKALLASGRASSISIENALLALPGVRGVRVVGGDTAVQMNGAPASGDGAEAPPLREDGLVRVYVDGLTHDNQAVLRERVEAVRAAGIYVVMAPATPINVQMVLRIEAAGQLGRQERLLLESQVRDAVFHYLDRLRMGEPLLFSQLTREVLNVKGVGDLTRFDVLTFREAGVQATGRVKLRVVERPKKGEALSILPQTELSTATGQRFLVDEAEAVRFTQKQTEAEVGVRALRAGRDGELPRTGSAAGWRPLQVGEYVLEVRNEAPIRLERHPPEEGAKKIALAPQERFVPDSIRVASEDKELNVYVQLLLLLPDPDTQAAILERVAAAVEPLRERVAAAVAPSLTLDEEALGRLRQRVAQHAAALADAVRALRGRVVVDPDPALAAEVTRAVESAVRALGSGGAVVQEELRLALQERVRQALAADPGAWKPRIAARLRESLTALLQEHARGFPEAELAALLRDSLRRSTEDRLGALRRALQDANGALSEALTAAGLAEARLQAARTKQEQPPAGADAAKLQQAVTDAQTQLTAAQAEVETRKTAASAAQAELDEQGSAATRALADAEAGLPDRIAEIRAQVQPLLQELLSPEALAAALGDRFSADSFQLTLRLRSVSFEGTVQADAPAIAPSFVERPVPAVVFLHDRTLELAGRLDLVLPLTATEEEKRTVRAQVRQKVGDYVDGLGPEEKVELDRLRALAEEHERVLRASFVLAPALEARNDRGTLTVRPFEKVVVTEAAPEITA